MVLFKRPLPSKQLYSTAVSE
uniref:Uncharacterized protein n=1 Tax=Anguilla anguilla TaxID=7936 RepID=A0A0E9TLG0_ANGAN